MFIHVLTPALLILLLLPLPSTVVSQQRTYSVSRENETCGTMTIEISRLANGYVEYRLREELDVITVADREERWIRTVTILADTALHPISIDGHERRGEVQWTIKGSCVNDVLYLAKEFKGGRSERWREDCAAVPDIMLPELLRHLERPLPENILSTREFKAYPAEIEITRSGEGMYEFQVGQQMQLRTDQEGLLTEWTWPDLGFAVHAARTARIPTACNLDGDVLWIGNRVQLPTRVDNLRNMEVLVALGNNVTTRLFPEDHRQRVISGEVFSADTMHLRIERAYQSFEEETLPLLDQSLLPYLKSSHFLSLDDERIKERAAALRNWDRNAANVARSILRWCGDSFVEDALVPVLPAGRLVAAPRGGALNAALLFVALARKAGVPARFVLGLIPADGHWKSTVWVEAWSGEWVSVDPMHGSILQDAYHVKLLHAATFQEIRQQAAQLRNAVHITMRDFERIDESPAAELSTAIVNGVYSNHRYRCEITAPQGWLIEERNVGREIVLSAVPRLGSEVRFEMHLFANPWLQPTEELFDTRVRALSAVLVDAEVIEKGELRFGDRRAPYVLYSYRDTRSESANVRIRTADCMFAIMERGYLLRFTAPEEEFAQYADQLERILQSMQLYEKD